MPLHVYFAYGSNMHGPLLATRLGRLNTTSFARCRGILRNYRLAFEKVSSTDPQVGYATVVPALGCSVEGVLNVITEKDLACLDSIELVPHHYTRCIMPVHDPAAQTDVEA